MISPDVLLPINEAIRRHCQSKGHADSPWQNPLEPHDCVSAFAMAQFLVEQRRFEHYVAVAPEGHVYGYFFERLGARVLSVFVDYPPRQLVSQDDLAAIRGGRVLILEDDVISGITLQLVVKELLLQGPQSLSLYLGRANEDQQLDNVPSQIETVFMAEDCLDPMLRQKHELDFLAAFAPHSPLKDRP